MVNKLKPKTEPFSEHLASVMQRYPKLDGYLLTLFRVFANSERFAAKAVPNLLDDQSPLSLRSREIVILRVTALRKCEYEWGVHAALFADAAGLSRQEINDTVAAKPSPEIWSEKELNLMNAVDQFCSSGNISAASRTAFERSWTVEQQLEILALCGTYDTVSFVANFSELENEPFARRFPTH